jgi:polysaccharide pyruvyl transferase WcaK-like protein
LAAEVEAVHALTGLPVVAFAIGRASGHEDQVSAKRLAARLEGRAWFRRAPDDLDIWQIMALIAGSAGYIGSSLHGFITAFAFAVPRVGLAPKVKKLITFRDDWDLPTMPAGVAFADLPVAVTQALAQDPAAMVAQAARVRAQAEAGLADLWAAVDPNTGEVTGD